MRAKLLCLFTLAAAVAAGVASAQVGFGEIRGPRTRSAPPQLIFAVIGHHVVTGELKPGGRLIALVDAQAPTFSCAPSQRGSEIVLNCSDGSKAQLTLDETGCGRSRSGEPASMCIGSAPKYAARHLGAPAGEVLRIDGERLVLEPEA